MGFPANSWDELLTDIGMYIGADGGAGWYSFIAIVMCIVILAMGNQSEHEKYDKHQ